MFFLIIGSKRWNVMKWNPIMTYRRTRTGQANQTIAWRPQIEGVYLFSIMHEHRGPVNKSLELALMLGSHTLLLKYSAWVFALSYSQSLVPVWTTQTREGEDGWIKFAHEEMKGHTGMTGLLLTLDAAVGSEKTGSFYLVPPALCKSDSDLCQMCLKQFPRSYSPAWGKQICITQGCRHRSCTLLLLQPTLICTHSFSLFGSYHHISHTHTHTNYILTCITLHLY